MAVYEITIEHMVKLNQKVEANSLQEAEQQAETMYQDYRQGQTTHVISTERRQSVEWKSAGRLPTMTPVGP
jgi:hypothetical protein